MFIYIYIYEKVVFFSSYKMEDPLFVVVILKPVK